ncbi:MAG TPA: hypothetical protein VNO30_00985 [Kofleriaceae bacterium]|nr:hypothetical protein [Kofleriaceae bacterium]
MKRAGRLVIAAGAALLACACSGKGTTTVGGGNETGEARTCESVRPKVERLYRAEAEAKEPKRVDEAVADNTTMVMNECAKAPAKVVACVGGVSSVADLERKCLAPLDDEGSEGEALRR